MSCDTLFEMNIADVISQIDSEISRLQQAKQLLAGHAGKKSRPEKAARKKRTMSAAGRARIAAAQRARWAKMKKAAK